MYIIETENSIGDRDENCIVLRPEVSPFHLAVYKTKQRSYKAMPIKYSETATVFKNEKDIKTNEKQQEELKNKLASLGKKIDEMDKSGLTIEEEIKEANIEKDYFCDSPKFNCLVAEIDEKPVGMILYSKFYWANDGEVLWISQMYVEQEYRKYGVFFKLINKLKQENKDIKIVSCATGNENLKMQKILKYYGAKEIDLKFYYKLLK